MLKARTIALWSIAVMTTGLVLSALALHALTDSERLKKLAREHVQKTWSRELTVGDMSLTFTPMPAFRATDLAVSNPGWTHDKIFLDAKELNMQVEFFPLLTKRIVVKHLSVDDFRIHLQHAPDGRKNWEQLAPSAPASGAAAANPPLMPPNALTLRKGTVSFRGQDDQETMWQLERAQFDSRTGGRDVKLDFRVSRDGHAMHVKGEFDDLSQLGMKEAVSSGSVRIESGTASLVVTGQLPLDPALRRYQINAAIDAASLGEAFGFLGITRRPPIELKARVKLSAAGDDIKADGLQLTLGKLRLTGDARITRRGAVPVFEARLDADRLDWVQTLLDAGEPPLPPKPAGELFHANPLPWSQLAATAGVEGTVRTTIQWLKLRSGIELTKVGGELRFADGRLTIPAFDAKLLAGSASGSALLDGARQSARVDLRLKDTQLGAWFSQTRKKVAFDGGRMQMHALVTANGKSMKELAASLTGPVTVDIGKATVQSKKLSAAETWLTGLIPFFSEKGTDQVELTCIGARLPFQRGIARGDNIIGVRSAASQLLTSGAVDLRQQSLDLHGPVRARAGIALGVSTFANEVRVDGKIAKPQVGLDKAGAPGAIARVAAAVLTGGISIIGTTIWDGAQAAPNPCQVALATAAGKKKK